MKTSPFMWLTGFLTNAVATTALFCLVPARLHGAPLSYAIRCADSAATQRALEAGVNPNHLDAAGASPLYHAVITRNPQLVEILLKAGARPDIDGQSKEPLWAACVNGDLEIIAALLNHGANPEAGAPPLRAVNAAILSGRVPVLRRLIDARPGMALPYLFARNQNHFEMSSSGAGNYVYDALIQRHYEMAEFLVLQGAVKADRAILSSLLFEAVSHDPQAALVVDALLKAGADPRERVGYGRLSIWGRELMRPTSAVEAAARMGHAALMEKLSAGVFDQSSMDRLLTCALNSGNEETVQAVRARFPDARPIKPARRRLNSSFLLGPETDPRNSWDTQASAEILLHPRLKPPPAADTTPGGKTRVAVIPDQRSGPEADLLSARLSMAKDMEVLDREEIANALRERDFAFGERRNLTGVGDQLRADELVLVSKPGSGDAGVLRAEIVDVTTGLVTSRMHAAAAAFDPDDWVGRISSAIARSREKFKNPDGGLHAVTLLGVGTIEGMAGADTARSLISAALMAEVDAMPGCIAMTRLQMKPVIEEQALGGTASLWKNGWALQAGVALTEDRRMVLRLRINNLNGGGSFDVETTGPPGDVAKCVRQAWAELVTKSNLGKAGVIPASITSDEAEVLLEEAQWRYRLREFEAASRLADTASLMGNSDPETQRMRIDARVRALLPPPETADVGTMLEDAGAWHEIVSLMNENFDVVHTAAVERTKRFRDEDLHGPSFWLSYLLTYRAGTFDWAADKEQKTVLKDFDKEFERWCRRLFAKCMEAPETGWLILQPSQLDDSMRQLDFHAFPWLADLMADWLVKQYQVNFKKPEKRRSIARLIYRYANLLSRQPSSNLNPAVVISEKFTGEFASFKEAAAQDTAFPGLADQGREEAARAAAARLISAYRSNRPEIHSLLPLWELSRYMVIESSNYWLMPETEDCLLAPVPDEGIPDQELLRKLAEYCFIRETPPDELINSLKSTATILSSREANPGTARLRSRVRSVARHAGLDSPELEVFLQKNLPPDIPRHSEDDETADAVGTDGNYFTKLTEGPDGASFFMVARVVPDAHRRLIWWVGCFVRGTVPADDTPVDMLPAIVRLDPTSGETRVVTASERWLTGDQDNRALISPLWMSLHANRVAVVWHVPLLGIWYVNPDTLALESLAEKPRIPGNYTQGPAASALIDDVFFVAEATDGYSGPQQVLRLRRGDKPVVSVLTGRRPMASALDTGGTYLELISPRKNGIRVFANVQPAYLSKGIMMADFDKSGSYVPESLVLKQSEVEQAYKQAGIAKNQIMSPQGKGWILKRGGTARTGRKIGTILWSHKGNHRDIPVDLPLPSGFKADFHGCRIEKASGRKTNEKMTTNAAELIKARGTPVIVHQNGDELGIMVSWSGFGGRYLFPIVWRVKESDIFPPVKE